MLVVLAGGWDPERESDPRSSVRWGGGVERERRPHVRHELRDAQRELLGELHVVRGRREDDGLRPHVLVLHDDERYAEPGPHHRAPVQRDDLEPERYPPVQRLRRSRRELRGELHVVRGAVDRHGVRPRVPVVPEDGRDADYEPDPRAPVQ